MVGKFVAPAEAGAATAINATVARLGDGPGLRRGDGTSLPASKPDQSC
jgi:hypothetical protein